ncbi:PREDICTED: DNA-directed primase/polymerase protein [Populus euphratica]|uniref:DNA-directed primase/polymerase protein n=1 Tax=Populus euphratica TaxID=75702 RepID=A0AAJ6VFA6_POPEU|nr:PREDICTED: DNA-directed primase/polymerase protein [Populus euphratica]
MGSKSSMTTTMEDVDRLFECFKCGISPPQSAVRERKRSKGKIKNQGISINEASPGSAEQPKKKMASNAVERKNVSQGKQISPVVFYGSPHGVPPKRPISLLRLLREIRIDLAEQQKSHLSKEVWATFPRQNEAMNFAKEHADVCIFSYQDHHNGQRRFLVSTYREFWRRYKNMDARFRHHYEVIQEGLPCHLYFDLEFSRRDNAERNGDEMVDLLISVTLEALFEKYSIQGNQDWIVELDSSTAEKFSRHLIIRIPKTAFKDNTHAGAFVSEICSRILSARGRDERFENLFIRKDSSSAGSPSQLFIDAAVYSRNRCFRLALSSKAGKNSVLLPTGRFKCKDMCEEDMFMSSLICSMDVDCNKLLVCKMDMECMKTLQFDTEVNYDYRRHCTPKEFPLNGVPSDTGNSPFPALDKFIESIASIGNISGKIRSWYWFSEYGLMVYSMSRNRYCERIGREHKSNHVMYVVDLRRADYYQKCHDPDCQGYRSPLRPIPWNVIPDPPYSYDSVQMVDQIGSANDNLKLQHVSNECEDFLLCDNKHDPDSCSKDSWWLEAIKVADDIENKQKTSVSDNNDEEDDNWWTAVEETASQSELIYFS